MKVTNIQWDTDGDEELLKSLPTEMEVPDGMDEDEISDYISDEIGFCHFYFKVEEENN